MSIVWLSGIGVALDFKLRRVWLCDGCRRCAWSGSMWQRGDGVAGCGCRLFFGNACWGRCVVLCGVVADNFRRCKVSVFLYIMKVVV